MRKYLIIFTVLLLVLAGALYYFITYTNFNSAFTVGEVIDNFNGVKVYYNGGVNNSSGRNKTSDGYNLGIRYQCVEFVKRYYYERFQHKMPDSMGHAKSLFDVKLGDGEINNKRGLIQFKNGSFSRPMIEDIVVFAPAIFNPYGHVAIVSNVFDSSLQIVQQNPGPFSSTRASYHLKKNDGRWFLKDRKTLGWLRRIENDSGFLPTLLPKPLDHNTSL